MKTRQIGSTGLVVTEIAFGAGLLGSMPDTYGPVEAMKAVVDWLAETTLETR